MGRNRGSDRKIADLAGAADTVAIGDTCGRAFSSISPTRCPTPRLPGIEHHEPIRQVKDAEEIARLAAGAAVDRIATRLQRGEIPLVGQTEAAVSAELGRQILEEGHDA